MEAAIVALPDSLRPKREDLDICANPGYEYHVSTSIADNGFTVQFTTLAPNGNARTTTCLVETNGEVTVQEQSN